MNTEKFIEKAKQIHGDKYDYSKIIYTKAINKVIIICKKHGEFFQQSNLHLHGSGCVNCYREISQQLQRDTKEIFLEKAKIKHGDKYDYSNVVYSKSNDKVIIICKEHGEFLQTPNKHLQGGCNLCGVKSQTQTRSSNTLEFIDKANITHNNKYDYSKVNYINNHTQIIIICKEHGEFLQGGGSHLAGHGCKKCSVIENADKCKSNTDIFIIKSREIHGDKYDYSKVNYIRSNDKVIIICKKHGEFLQTPKSHITKNAGCVKCATENIRIILSFTYNDFVNKAKIIHDNIYDYSKVEYINYYTRVDIICNKHGIFSQKPSEHLQGCGCQECGKEKIWNVMPRFCPTINNFTN